MQMTRVLRVTVMDYTKIEAPRPGAPQADARNPVHFLRLLGSRVVAQRRYILGKYVNFWHLISASLR